MRHMGIAALLAVTAACAGEGGSASGTPDDSAAVSIGSGDTPYMAQQPYESEQLATPDIGIGAVTFLRPDSVGPERVDTILIRRTPSAQAPIIARYSHTYGSAGTTWDFRLETSDPDLIRNDVEFGYEDLGLPVDTVVANGGWAQVIYAIDDSGQQRLGWVEMSGNVRLLPWTEELLQTNLFFRAPDSLQFYSAPDGPPVTLDIAISDTQDGFDYTMAPLGIRDDWMQVAVTTPSNYCAEPANPRTDTVWIRFRDPDGRPRVWYHTRGC